MSDKVASDEDLPVVWLSALSSSAQRMVGRSSVAYLCAPQPTNDWLDNTFCALHINSRTYAPRQAGPPWRVWLR